MLVSRTLTRFAVRIVKLTDEMEIVTLYDGETVAPHLTKTDARKLATCDIPRGSIVKIDEVEKVKYACELTDFLKIAHVVTDADDVDDDI